MNPSIISGQNALDALIQKGGADDWQEPQPLTKKHEQMPYPIHALPDSIRGAVDEVQSFAQAPYALAAQSALATLSLASQAHIDVRRAEGLQGPVSLDFLALADSGERKTTVDRQFNTPIKEFQERQQAEKKPEISAYLAKHNAWESRYAGVKENIRQLAKKGQSTVKQESQLEELERERPSRPKVPRLIYSDATPEALAFSLANQWPSGAIISNEGGAVFGAHAMGQDSIMRNLAFLNQLWDGTPLTIDRRTSDSFSVSGARLTVSIQVQEPVIRDFLSRSGVIARGSGFLARFLIAWPESTQGTRFFKEPPAYWPALTAFQGRINEILSLAPPLDEESRLKPSILDLDPAAKNAWVNFHDSLERDLGAGGDLFDVRDIASKTADNAARLAALFQFYQSGISMISVKNFNKAALIAAWHLSEARRFLGELSLPLRLVDAQKLDTWLIQACSKNSANSNSIFKNYARQNGPIRDAARLDAALSELAQLDRIKLLKNSRIEILINPGLLP